MGRVFSQNTFGRQKPQDTLECVGACTSCGGKLVDCLLAACQQVRDAKLDHDAERLGYDEPEAEPHDLLRWAGHGYPRGWMNHSSSASLPCTTKHGSSRNGIHLAGHSG